MKKQRHINIPVFVTHTGCPNQCVFCDQRVITGEYTSEGPESVKLKCEKFLTVNAINQKRAQIAFFGGSFTGIERALLTAYLEAADCEIKKSGGRITGIRFSTRPDYIDGEILALLSRYPVKNIELGVQSMDDAVLIKSKRGHTAADSRRAFEQIKRAGIELTAQMMLGLPGAGLESDLSTAEEIIAAAPASARIYPTVVLKGTELYEMQKKGEYAPLSLGRAVFLAARVKTMFEAAGIKVIRTGLCAADNFSGGSVYSGPYHPAFGELTDGEIYFWRLCEKIREKGEIPDRSAVVIECEKSEASKIAGHKRSNLNRLSELFKTEVKVRATGRESDFKVVIEQKIRDNK